MARRRRRRGRLRRGARDACAAIVRDRCSICPRWRSAPGKKCARRGLSGRVEAVGGSFLDGDLPAGADVVSLVRVLHDHDDESALRLLARIHAASPPGATLLIAEPMAGTPGAEPVGDAYFGFYLLAMGSGRPRTSPRSRRSWAKPASLTSRTGANSAPVADLARISARTDCKFNLTFHCVYIK